MHAFRDRGEVSSWQSRSDNPEDQRYGGAFIVTVDVPELGGEVKVLVSFSGLPEIWDEAYGLLLLQKLGWKPRLQDYHQVLSKSHNVFAERLLHENIDA